MMSKTNQVCVTCAQRDTCQYYDPNRTICVPVEVSDYGQFAGSLQPTIDWKHYRIQFVGQIASSIMSNYEFYAHAIGEECKKSGKSRPEMVAQMSLDIADALIAELQKKQD